MNVDGISIYTKAQVTNANDQVGRNYIGREELKMRRIGHNTILEQAAVHIASEADLQAHVSDVLGRQLSVKGLLDTRTVVSVMPISTFNDMCFDRLDVIPTKNRTQNSHHLANQNSHHLATTRSKASLDEFSVCQKPGRTLAVNPKTRLRAQLRRHNRPKRRGDTDQGPREKV